MTPPLKIRMGGQGVVTAPPVETPVAEPPTPPTADED